MDTGPFDAGRDAELVTAQQTRVAPRPPVRRSRLVLRLAIMTVILVVLLGGLYGFNEFRRKAIADYFASNKPPPTPVAAVQAEARAAPRFLSGIGSLAAVRQVIVSPEVGGRVKKITLEAGQRIKAGSPLVQIDDANERAQLSGLRAQIRLAQTSLTRANSLLANRFSTQATVDQLRAQLDQAQSDAQRLEVLIGQKLIRAPFDGVLGIRQVNLGEYVQPGTALVTLTDLDTLFVNFTLPEQVRNAIAIDQSVKVTSDAFADRVFEARVTAVEPQVDVEMRAIKIQATLPNPEHRLLPGMFASVQLMLPSRPDVVTIPETAVDYTLYGDTVYVVREDGKDAEGKPVLTIHRTLVKTGERFEGKVAILSGLNVGERVATTGQMKLIDGAEVNLSGETILAQPAQTPRQ